MNPIHNQHTTPQKLRVGILFGGPSREREIAFAGGRTVYDNLDKSLFTPVPIFIDSLKKPILLDWPYVYKGTIRDFYPPMEYLNTSYQIYVESLNPSPEEHHAIASAVGTPISWESLADHIDIAFLALHGSFGEDGQIQGLLASMDIPYTGSDIMSCAMGMDKVVQKKLMQAGGFPTPKIEVIKRDTWLHSRSEVLLDKTIESIGLPIVIRPANQGSSIGVSILSKADEIKGAIDKAFFIKEIKAANWHGLDTTGKRSFIQQLIDIREGIGLPAYVGGEIIYHPDTLIKKLDVMKPDTMLLLEGQQMEQSVILESFIDGKEFSCIVIRMQDGSRVALPPTEIRKGGELYDYKSKYLPGLSRKITPIDLPNDQIHKICNETERLFDYLGFKTYARIDGFITADETIFLNDPNTTSGMMPSSFFFHQAAEVGLNPSQFLTYILHSSLLERQREALVKTRLDKTIADFENLLLNSKSSAAQKIKVGVIFGGYSFERHISVESGRNIYEKLASSTKYQPIPLFLKRNGSAFELFHIPVNLLLKDNADDIGEGIEKYSVHPITAGIREAVGATIDQFKDDNAINHPTHIPFNQLNEWIDVAFIALHGRPGEDGALQAILEQYHIPYNGSGVDSSGITIHKYATLQTLAKHGFKVAQQWLAPKSLYLSNKQHFIHEAESKFGYPLIVKPVDDGCSSAVRKINSQDELTTYLDGLFRSEDVLTKEMRSSLKLAYNEEFPQKEEVLIESLVSREDAVHFIEITGGLLTHYEPGGKRYEMFEPSEALATGSVLTLEEKFLAGEGQNITPARFSPKGSYDSNIASQVKQTLQKAAEILGVEGYARIDAFVKVMADGSVETWIIEVNSLPGMTPATCIFHQSAINGYKPFDFIDHILMYAMQKANKPVNASV